MSLDASGYLVSFGHPGHPVDTRVSQVSLKYLRVSPGYLLVSPEASDPNCSIPKWQNASWTSWASDALETQNICC